MIYTNPAEINQKEIIILEQISKTAQNSAHDLKTNCDLQFGSRYYWIATEALSLFLNDDDLPALEKSCHDQIKEEIKTFRKENPEASKDNFYDYISERIWQIADANTPIYTSTIEALHFLYGNILTQAYQDAGIGKGKDENYKQLAIFCYLKQSLYTFYQELQKKEGTR